MRNLPPIDTGEPHAQIPKFGAVEMCLIGASLQQQPCDLQRENLDLEMHACVFITMRHTRKTPSKLTAPTPYKRWNCSMKKKANARSFTIKKRIQ